MTKLPHVKTLTALLIELKTQIGGEYRASDDSEDNTPGMQVTIGASGESTDDWSYQTGDNSYSGGAYGYQHWAVISLYRLSNSTELAREIRAQLYDLIEA